MSFDTLESERTTKVKVKPFGAKLAHTAGAYPGFRSMKQTRSIATPSGWDASPTPG